MVFVFEHMFQVIGTGANIVVNSHLATKKIE